MLQMLFEFAPSIAQQGLIAGPFRSTRWTWVDARDVAAVAVAALSDPAHAGRTYTVTGAESLSYPQIAERLSHSSRQAGALHGHHGERGARLVAGQRRRRR